MIRLLVAGATWAGGHDVVQMSHAWRRGVNSFYTTGGDNHTLLSLEEHKGFGTSEVWVQHPDWVADECKGCQHPDWKTRPDCPFPEHCGWCGQTNHGCRFHEQRYVITPSLANQTFFSDYDWMLYADAETIWFHDNVVDMVSKLNPDDPWYISESMFPTSNSNCVFPGREPVKHDGCIYSPSPDPFCTPSTILNASTCAWATAEHKDGRANPKAPGQVWNGGNWGFIVSRGAMARITPEQWRDCVECKNDFHGCYGGGDCRLGECMWRHGVAPTLPDRDYSIPGIDGYRLGEVDADSFIAYLRDHKTGCDDVCKRTLRNPLALNVRTTKQMAQLEVALYEVKKAM